MNKNEPTELQKLLIDQVRDIYWAEQKLAKTLPKLAKKAQSPALQNAFTSHLAETKTHIQRLERIFGMLGLRPRAKKCDAMQGLLDEGDGLAEEYADSPALDAALICAAQKVEHYEIATYGTMCAFAKRLGLTEVVKLLSASLKEEGAADLKLTQIAESKANAEAQQ